jgi:hypothetical protein
MTVASRAFAAMLKIGPPVTRQVTVERDVPVRAPDGADLLTDVYLARARDPLPVILMRTPYGRRGPYGTIARLFAERGYHAVVQSTRGTSGSGGQIDYDREAADGRAAADWIIKQPWSNGEIGGFGGSYLTFTQLALASTRPPQLKAMALGVWSAFVRTPLRVRRALAPACPCSTPTRWPSGTRSATTATRCGMTSPATRTGRLPISGRRCATWAFPPP